MEACHKNNIKVSAIPGPTAPILALTMSGLPTDKFTFNGFIPASTAGSRKALVETSNLQTTQIWFSTTSKLISHLKTMLSTYGNRNAAVVREMTKLHEEIKNSTLKDLLSHYQECGPPKGEIVIVVNGMKNKINSNNKDELNVVIKEALNRLSLKDAVNEVSIVTGTNKKQIYQQALNLLNKKSSLK